MLARLTLAVFLVLAAPAFADRYAPPPWFVDATNELQERGARCALLDDRWSLRPGQEQWAVGESCTHPLPRALRASFGRSEACWSQAVQSLRGSRAGEESAYLCSLLANPGTDAHPNAASWRCGRISVNHARGARDDPAWTADGGRLFAPRTFPTLKQCLAPRLILAPARRRAQALAATCSHKCTIRVIVTRRGSGRELARLRVPLPFGIQREIPLWLKRPLPREVTLRVRIASVGVMRHMRLDARWTGDRFAFAPATIDVHER